MTGRTWLAAALGLQAIALPAAASTRRIEATADAVQLTAVLLPEGEAREWTICAGDCPSGVGSVRVTDPALALAGSGVETRGKVHVDLAVIGRVEAQVACTVTPRLRDGGQVQVEGGGCRIERLEGAIPFLLRRTAIATLEPVLGALLQEEVAAAGFDLLASAREGMLAWFTADPAARAPEAARCVQAIRSLTVRDGETPVLVVGVDVACG